MTLSLSLIGGAVRRIRHRRRGLVAVVIRVHADGITIVMPSPSPACTAAALVIIGSTGVMVLSGMMMMMLLLMVVGTRGGMLRPRRRLRAMGRYAGVPRRVVVMRWRRGGRSVLVVGVRIRSGTVLDDGYDADAAARLVVVVARRRRLRWERGVAEFHRQCVPSPRREGVREIWR